MVSVTLDLKRALTEGETFSLGFAAGKNQVLTEASDTSAPPMTVTTGFPKSVKGYVEYMAELTTSLVGTKTLGHVQFARADGNTGFSADAAGKASTSSTSQETVYVVPSRSLSTAEVSAADGAVSLPDAIAILKMIVGLNVNANNTAATAYQVIAADFNQNGSVGLDDAIGVLKHVVGLQAPRPTLKFVDAQAVPAALNLDSYNANATKASGNNWLSGKIAVGMKSTLDDAMAQPVQVVGVLVGDVNHDWNPNTA
jgi:hypothetical protein